MNFLRARETAHDYTAPAAAMPTPFTLPCTKGPQFYDFAASTSTAAFQPKCAPPDFSKYWWDGVGYYSPAVCPAGYTVGCTRFDKNQGPPVEKTETAMQCVPSGFACGANPSFVTSGTTTVVMIQIRWAESDLTNLATHPIVAGALPTDESVYIPFDLRDERPTPKGAKPTAHGELKRGGIMEMGRWFANRAAAEDAKRAVSGTPTPTKSGSPRPSTSPEPTPFQGEGGLSGGAIAGIVIGVIGGLAILCGIIFWVVILSRRKKADSQPPLPMTYPPQPPGQMQQPQYMPELHGQQAVPARAPGAPGAMTVSSVSPGMTSASMSQQATPAPPYVKHDQPENQVPVTGQYAPLKPAASPQPNPSSAPHAVRAGSYPPELHEQTRAFEMQAGPPERPIPELGVYEHNAPTSQPSAPLFAQAATAERPVSSVPPPWAADPLSPATNWNVPDVMGAPSFVGGHSRGQSYMTAATARSPAPPSVVSDPSSTGQAQPSQWAPPPPVPSPGEQGAQGGNLEAMRAEAAQLESRRQRLLELERVEEEQRRLQARIAAAQGGQPGGSAS